MNKNNLQNKVLFAIKKGIYNALKECDCCGDFGGVSSPYSTPMNTIGVGDIVLAGTPAMTAGDFASDANLGSGDRFDIIDFSRKTTKINRKKKNTKKSALATKKSLPYFPYLVFSK